MIYDGQRKAVRTPEGRWLSLTPIEASLFERLLDEPGRLTTYKDLIAVVPGWDYLDETTTRHYLHLHIGRLRGKTGDDAILTVIDAGYLFNPGIQYTCPTCGRFK